ncbi:UNVERIFIED_CONTAM: Chitin synthase, class 3 [Siphonaria sp. JEL0065]|nr:Chitin synthase, class 3 [Siphonaria sp. JEL0065]
MPVPYYDLSEMEEGIIHEESKKTTRHNVEKTPKPTRKQAFTRESALIQPHAWVSVSQALTSWCSSHVLIFMSPKFRNASILQAWREKVSLIVTAFSTSLYCASLDITHHQTPDLPYLIDRNLAIYGKLYDFKQTSRILNKKAGVALTSDFHGSDLTALFLSTNESTCHSLQNNKRDSLVPYPVCTVKSRRANSTLVVPSCLSRTLMQELKPIGPIYFTQREVVAKNLTTFRGRVYNIPIHLLDNTHRKRNTAHTSDLFKTCGEPLLESYIVGYVESHSWIHLGAEFIRDGTEVIMIAIGAFKLLVSIVFHYWTAKKQVQGVEKRKNAVYDVAGSSASSSASSCSSRASTLKEKDLESCTEELFIDGDSVDPYIVMLVTCFSEDRESIQKTVESLALTHYENSRKLLFLVCDGMVTGAGNPESTPDACLSLFSGIDGLVDEDCQSYTAVADGDKRMNMASVHSGFYKSALGGRVPMVCVVKRGTEAEEGKLRAGNRGKRDSQMILFNFLASMNSRIPPNMSSLEVDLAIKIQRINGGMNPSCYSLLLMVDADTAVQEDALSFMVQTMENDPKVMGLCGETKIENANDSWIARIQVFDYYISHHFGKAIESVFGRVLCLPGCFSMYRIKDVPSACNGFYADEHLLIDRDVLIPYQENVAETLHAKNLLHLGEDRYLTALAMMRFPDRKITFVPQSLCFTTVPHTFSMLLSQRRRWINSSMHNSVKLLTSTDRNELWVFILKAYIILELISTILLPITFCGILVSLLMGITDVLFELLVNTLVASLVILCIRLDLKMITDLIIYLSALPLWYFVFPLYGFWSQDNFSWGETRKVEGESMDQGQEVPFEKSGLSKFYGKAMRKNRHLLFFFVIVVVAFQSGGFIAHYLSGTQH